MVAARTGGMSLQALGLCLAGVLVSTSTGRAQPTGRVNFDRQIRPLLTEHCFQCHGPDEKERKAKLRLDTKEGAFAALRDGGHAIVRGKSGDSESIARVVSADASRRMPPARTGKKLTPRQIDLLRRWIDEGAEWSQHWAYVPPRRPEVPAVPPGIDQRNTIDRFVLTKLRGSGLQQSAEADRRTLIRRLSLDLTGLPPTPEAVETFVADKRPEAYGRLVEHLLASEHFGERMAQQWLDLARFGDSDGYHDDTPRLMWQYRDYVIDSFNKNKRFDQFTLEQLAGDLLPNATLGQKIGSAFHRCGPTSSEGGADAQEYLAKYAVDRVNTTATVWLGVTMQCAECHDHKYDPFTTRQFYQLFAFFNQVPEDALYRGNEAPPIIATPTREQQRRLADIHADRTKLEKELNSIGEADDPALDAAQATWEQKLAAGKTNSLKLSAWHGIGPFFEQGQTLPYDAVYPPEKEIDLKKNYQDGKLRWTEHKEWVDGKPHYLSGENCAIYAYRTIQADTKQVVTFYLGSDDYLKVWVNDKLIHTSTVVRAVAPNQDRVTVILQPGENRVLLKIVNLQGGYGFYFSTTEKARDEQLEEIVKIARRPASERDQAQRAAIRRYYRERFAPRATELRGRLADLQKQQADIEKAIPKLRIMADVPERRPTYILVRGDFRTLGDKVEPGVPDALGKLPADAKPNRLALARWLVSRDHPLTARVAVNRIWQMLFGQGLVRTSEDFGVRGEPPSHPELLDWLAVEFIESGWDVKHLLRLMVTSVTYRQTSKVSADALAGDPNNVLLARGPRQRLPAEMIRDNALAVAGLLDLTRIGGPSVKPYQPGDLWREMSYGDSPDKAYVQDHGKNLYRRGIYTYWKRSILYPSFAVFDAPNREVCTARRPVTNTPLQALVTLNDVTYVEAARVFAQNLLAPNGNEFKDRLDLAFRRAVARPATERERELLAGTHTKLLERFRADGKAASELVAAGEHPRPAKLDTAELAAWTALCQIILNLDETMTKE
jgi:hypothetical protein